MSAKCVQTCARKRLLRLSKIFSLHAGRNFAPLEQGEKHDPTQHRAVFLQVGHKCPILPMRGNEFIRKVQALAKERGLASRVDEKRGKGSHVTLYFGDRLSVVRDPKAELKTGTLHAMCKQLGIRRDDL